MQNYQDDFTFWLFDASIPMWLVNAIISAVGAVSGFLWLRHPQLCVSLEYKVRMKVKIIYKACYHRND